MATREQLRVVKRKHVDRLLAWPNVTAVDINNKMVGGQKTDQLCLVIWVRKKKHESGIAPNEILPKEIDGFAVDVFEGEATLGEGFEWPATQSQGAEQSNASELKEEKLVKLRPLDTLRGGDSLAPLTAEYAGTLGYFVRRKNTVGVLSNAHVMNSAQTKLISPARKDGGTPDDLIGKVNNVVVTTEVDCGYAPLRGNITRFFLKDGTAVAGSEPAHVGTLIKFYGRTSGLVQRGGVASVDWSGTISGKPFHDQILITERSQPGDSGSLLINRDNNNAIGLIFAETSAGNGLANHIADVLGALNVTIAIQA